MKQQAQQEVNLIENFFGKVADTSPPKTQRITPAVLRKKVHQFLNPRELEYKITTLFDQPMVVCKEIDRVGRVQLVKFIPRPVYEMVEDPILPYVNIAGYDEVFAPMGNVLLKSPRLSGHNSRKSLVAKYGDALTFLNGKLTNTEMGFFKEVMENTIIDPTHYWSWHDKNPGLKYAALFVGTVTVITSLLLLITDLL